MAPCGTDNIADLGCVLGNILSALFYIAGGVFGISAASSAIKMASSQGDPKATNSAKARLTWSILGFIIAVGVVAVVKLVGGFFGANGILFPGGQINIPTDF